MGKDNPWLEQARTDPKIVAGGYDVGEYTKRTMFEAFAGLGVFVEEDEDEDEEDKRGKEGGEGGGRGGGGGGAVDVFGGV